MLRYILGNLHDWRVDNDVPYQYFPIIDQHALSQLENVFFWRKYKSVTRTTSFSKYSRSYNDSQLLICQISTLILLKIDWILGEPRVFPEEASNSSFSTSFIHIESHTHSTSPSIRCLEKISLSSTHIYEVISATKFVFEPKWPLLN